MLCKKQVLKVLQVKHNNGEDQRLYSMKRNLRNQSYLTVGACHDVRDLSYFTLSKFNFSHNTLLSKYNILLYHKEYFTISQKDKTELVY